LPCEAGQKLAWLVGNGAILSARNFFFACEMSSDHHPPVDRGAIGLSRLINISDGVFAVAMTFLAFTIRLPTIAPDGARPPLSQTLAQMVPQLYTVGIAFVAAARFWVIHLRIFSFLKRADGAITGLNLIGLLTLVLLPISGDFIGVYPQEPLAVALFAGNMALVGLANMAIWLVASRRGLLNESATRRDVRDGHWLGALSTGVFVLSVPVCWINVRCAKAMWLAVILIIFMYRTVEEHKHRPSKA
jgi:uncharacterized membrane protein